MTGKPKFAVDTSFIIALFRRSTQSSYLLSEVAFPVPVIGELRFGVLGGRGSQTKLAELEGMVRSALVLVVDAETAAIYANLRHRLKVAGTPIPENDVWIAASCMQHDLPLLTLDGHFKLVEGLRIEWP